MSRMPTKDPGENQNGYRTSEFPFVLPKMQTGNVNSYITIKNIYYQRAGRKDAEPIIHESNLRSIGSVFVPYCMIVFLEDEDENSMCFVVRPEKQGQGIGSRLIKPVLQALDDYHILLYLETHKEINIHIYEHFGFHMVDNSAIPGTNTAQYAMLWTPKN